MPATQPTNPNPITTAVDETLLLIGMALNERDSAGKGIRLLKGLVKLSPFTEATDVVANAASSAAHGWARCQAQTYITRGLDSTDQLVDKVTKVVGPDVYHRAATGEHGHGLPSVALALISLVVAPLVSIKRLKAKAKADQSTETVGRFSFHQDMVKLIDTMAVKGRVDLPAFWTKASKVKAKAATELAADEADGFAYGRMAEADNYLTMIELVNDFIEINSLHPYNHDGGQQA